MSRPPENFPTKDAMVAWMEAIAPFGIFTTDTDLRLTSWNHWLIEHSGLAAAAVIGRPLLEVFPDLEARRLVERFRRAVAGEISVLSTALHKYLVPLPVTIPSTQLPHMLQTGRIAPLREQGVVVGTITIIEDVTQRESQAGVLSRQQELDRLLSSSLALLLQSADPCRDVADIFSRITLTLGIDAHFFYLRSADGKQFVLESSAGAPPRQREALTTLPGEMENVQPAAGGNAGSETFVPAVHESALERLGLHARCSFPVISRNRTAGFVTFANYRSGAMPAADLDILSRIARYIGIALERVTREREVVAASRAKDDFLAALSHELRTPLNPILLLASESATNPEFPAAAREDFREIEKNALLEARLIDDLLDLTRIEHGKLQLHRQPVDAHEIVRDAVETMRSDVAAKRISLGLNFQAPRALVSGDATRLQQVVWNLLKNAVKFSPSGSSVRVTTTNDTAADEFVLTVIDEGIGMEPHEVARIFRAFSQGDHAGLGSGHRFGGLGLGLAISRKLVELHGGRILAASAGKNRGATFTVVLPLVAAPAAKSQSPVSSRDVTRPPDDAAGFARRILLVEDHESTRVPLASMLTRHGYNVVAVATMNAALRQAAEKPFDVLLSDLGLPDGDGFSLMRTLRERYGMRGIAISGYGTEADLARSTAAGFMDHLTKPITLPALERSIARVSTQPDAGISPTAQE